MNKEVVLKEIEDRFSKLKSILSAFSDEELNRVPFDGSWTAGQVAEHIIKSASGIPDEKTAPADRPFDEKISAIRDMFLDMNSKSKAMPFLQPEQSHYRLEELLSTFNRLQDQHLNWAKEKDLEPLCMDMELPIFGYLTRYEWIRFIMVHLQRHTMQLENIYKMIRS